MTDPEVATLATLTNVQNSLFIPDLGSLLNRRPTYNLTREPTFWQDRDRDRESTKPPSIKPPSIVAQPLETDAEDIERPGMDRTFTIRSHMSQTSDHYAVLPHGITLEGWSMAEKEELNDHVRHMLHSRRAAFKRSMKGFGQYVRRRKLYRICSPVSSSDLSTQLSVCLLLYMPLWSPCSAWLGFFSLSVSQVLLRLIQSLVSNCLSRLDQCWKPSILHYQCHRQRLGCPVCYHR